MMKIKKIQRCLLAAAICTACTAGTIYAAGNAPAELDGETVEYSMQTGVITATGHVVMKRGDAVVTGAQASYNSKSQEGNVTGGVTAKQGDMNMTASAVRTDGQNHMLATGGVHGVKGNKTFTGQQVDYYPDREYMLIASGGTITSPDGTFTADHMEGWMKENHFRGNGNAHLVSPPKNLEAGGDQLDYFSQQNGKAILTGNAWAIQNNNTLKSQRLTIYLAGDGQAKVQ